MTTFLWIPIILSTITLESSVILFNASKSESWSIRMSSVSVNSPEKPLPMFLSLFFSLIDGPVKLTLTWQMKLFVSLRTMQRIALRGLACVHSAKIIVEDILLEWPRIFHKHYNRFIHKPSEKRCIRTSLNTEYKYTHSTRPTNGKVVKTEEVGNWESSESLSQAVFLLSSPELRIS